MKSQHVFLALIGAQSLHSLEEYIFRLWETFPPAQFLTGLVSADPARGFIVINLSVIALGIWCYWWPVRRHWTSATPIAWFWVALGLVNGVGHPAWSVLQGGYTPGLITSLVLLPLALLLAAGLSAERAGGNPRAA